MDLKRLLPIVAIILLVILTGCTVTKQYPSLDLNDIEVQPDSPQEFSETFRVALAAITSTQSSIVYYEELLDLLEKELGRPIEIIQRNTYAEINELLRTGQVDLAFICTYAYVSGHDQFDLELVAAPVKDGQAQYQSYIIVRQDSGIDSFDRLKGKRFAFSDPMSTTGYLYPMSLLKKQGKGPEMFFADFCFTYSHDNSTRAVFEGIVDGAAVESLVYRQMAEKEPQITGALKIINKSSFFPSPPVVVRAGLPEELKKQLDEFFLNLSNDEEGKRILTNMGLDGFIQVEDSLYDNVRTMGKVVQP